MTARPTRAELAAQILHDVNLLKELADTVGNTIKGEILLDPEHSPQHPAYSPHALRDLDLKTIMNHVSYTLTNIGDRVRMLALTVPIDKGECQ